MPAIAALLDSRAALSALRRSLPRGSAAVVACRSPGSLERALRERLLDAIVLGVRTARSAECAALRARYPGIPVVMYGVLRSEDAEALGGWQQHDVAAVAVEGVDDPLVGDLVVRVSRSARRKTALAGTPAALRLTEPLQQSAWNLLLSAGGLPLRTTPLARTLGLSREHLSRQFGAGGAPNLKRVADLLTVLSALSLLRNPGYTVPDVARLLGLSTPSHLRAMVRRIAGAGIGDAMGWSDQEVVRRFQRGARRSRAGDR